MDRADGAAAGGVVSRTAITVKRRNKYHARKTRSLLTKRLYDSKREAEFATSLEQKKRDGKIIDYLEQVPIKLPGDITYRVDFVVFEPDARGGPCDDVRFIEVKGFETPAWKMKLKLLEESHWWIYDKLEIVR